MGRKKNEGKENASDRAGAINCVSCVLLLACACMRSEAKGRVALRRTFIERESDSRTAKREALTPGYPLFYPSFDAGIKAEAPFRYILF